MSRFDQSYYNNIWGSVHRHDYTNNLADALIAKYGKVRMLDIGTGCGHLVKMLREKGCDAWGLEVSNHALQNSCAPDYVRKGSVTDIPFSSSSFDVVYSQGLWEYVAKSEVQIAWAECNRVGRFQEHNYDTTENDNPPEYRFVTYESRAWWHEQFYPKVLIACPVHKCKEYSLQRWIDNVKQFTYPNYELLWVDNSERALNYPVPTKWIGGDQQHAMLRVTKSMEVIRQHFLAGNYKWWFNLECDIIPPHNVIEQLMKWGGDSDWISHSYPMRGNEDLDEQQGIGCCLLSRRMMEDFNFSHAGDNSPDGWLWQQVRPSKKYKVMELWSYFNVKHLAQ